MSEPRISEVRVAAAHDGDAELVVTLAFGNGGQSQVTLDEFAVRALFASCAVTTADDLIGASWQQVRDALVASSSRYHDITNTEPLGGT